MSTLTTTPGVQSFVVREARDGAARMRHLAARLADEGDHPNALNMALQAGLLVHAIGLATRKNIPEYAYLAAVVGANQVDHLPGVVATAYAASAAHVIGNMADLDVAVLREMRRGACTAYDMLIASVERGE